MMPRKPKKTTCNCRRRKHGNPKLSTGLCYGGCLREAVRQRIDGKREVRLAWFDLDEDEVED